MQPQQKPKHTKKVGASLSLQKFSNLKKSGYDKRAKLEKERALNAAKVNAYKKLKKRLADKLEPKPRFQEDALDEEKPQQERQQPEQQHMRQDQAAEPHQQQQQQHLDGGRQRGGPHGQGGSKFQKQQRQHGQGQQGGGKKHKPLSHTQRIAAEVQAKKEAEQREREERQRAAEERRAKLAADAKQRAAKSKAFRKKTAHGQPVMKHRMEKLLEQLQG